ncbi:Heterogeneous nuclear ribonucleoprotein 1 [Glycine max]|nr:Heterogeneous nuclear ribonucleoprotein 1 [Glycine max]
MWWVAQNITTSLRPFPTEKNPTIPNPSPATVPVPAQFIKHFGKYGEITDSVIMKDRKTGQPRGFGFITYADPSVVDKVIEDPHIINGKQMNLETSLHAMAKLKITK